MKRSAIRDNNGGRDSPGFRLRCIRAAPLKSPRRAGRSLSAIISIRPFPHQRRAEAVGQRIIADHVRGPDPVMPMANDTGRAIRRLAHAALTRAELGRRTCLPWIKRGGRIRKDAKRESDDNHQQANHGPTLSKPCRVITIQGPASSAWGRAWRGPAGLQSARRAQSVIASEAKQSIAPQRKCGSLRRFRSSQ